MVEGYKGFNGVVGLVGCYLLTHFTDSVLEKRCIGMVLMVNFKIELLDFSGSFQVL